MYAVVAMQWHQYIVKQGDEIVVDRLDSEEGSKVSFDTILAAFDEDGKTVKVWKPHVKWSVTASVKEHWRWDKVRVMKFQSKKRYKRTKGFKAHQTILSIDSVEIHE